jgi:IclR family acetate operon transcriptional repressor
MTDFRGRRDGPVPPVNHVQTVHDYALVLAPDMIIDRGPAGDDTMTGRRRAMVPAVVFRHAQLESPVTGKPERDAAGPIQSVDRAVAILEILARDGEAGVTEVARELGVHKSTASRLLAALDRRELVAQDSARGRFRLGVGIVRLAGAASARLDVVQESRPVCRALAEELGETVNLAILSSRDALYLDQAAGPAALSPHNWAGKRIPLHATSDGKVLLAYLPEAELAGHLATPLHRFTEHTVTDPAELAKGLAEVRRHGFAAAVDELEPGLTAVAAPVRDAEGRVVASISASGPSFRITGDRIPAVAALVRQAAAEISRRLGWAAAG